MKIYSSLITLFLLHLASFSMGQDVEAFGSKSNYSLRGGLNVGSQFYKALGDTNPRLSPFGYRINGNLSAQLGPITVPVSFSFNHINGSISSPFNLYGASPYYRWIKLHLGYRSLNFNPYTYSGRAFNGIGLTLSPGNLEVTAFTGTLRNRYAIRDTVVAGAIELPSNERRIQGLKVGFGKRSANISISAVRVKDDQNNISAVLDPVENFAFGIQGEVRIWKRIKLKSNIASSIYTGDQEASAPDVTSDFEQQVREAITINATTRLSFAGDAFLGYDSRGYKLGLKYKRIDPFYTSLGINFIQNDIENFTINAGAPFVNRRLRIRGSLGIQRDNISNHKAFTSQRLIGSISSIYLPSKNINLQARFSNYQHQNQSGLVVVNDTLKILTTTRSMSLGGMIRILDNDKYSHSTNINIFRNNVIDEARVEGGNIFTGIGANLAYTVEIKAMNLSLSPTLNYNKFQYAENDQGRVGGGLSISHKALQGNWFNTLNFVLNQNTYDGKSNGTLININLRSRYKVSTKHHLGLRIFYINNDVILTDGYSELRGNLSYGFTFR